MLWIPRVLTCILVLSFARGDSQEAELISRLLNPEIYNKDIGPAGNPLIIKFGLAMLQLNELNTEKGYMDAMFWLRLVWNDSRLAYENQDLPKKLVLRVKPTEIWTPNMEIGNGLNSIGIEYGNSPFRVLVYNNSESLWVPSVRILSTCESDSSVANYFPFDSRTCSFEFTENAYNSDELKFVLYNDKNFIDMSDYWKSNYWAFEGSSASITNGSSPTGGIDPGTTNSSIATFTLTFRRKLEPYLLTIVVPTILISFLSLLTPLVPNSHHEKIVLGFGSIVSLILVLLYVGRIGPTMGFPLIGKYMIFLIVLNVVHLIGMIILTNWANPNNRKGEAPKFVKEIGGILRMKPDGHSEPPELAKEDQTPAANSAEAIIMDATKEQQRRETVQKVWTQGALVLERLMFIIMFVITALAGLIYLAHFPGFIDEDEAIRANKI